MRHCASNISSLHFIYPTILQLKVAYLQREAFLPLEEKLMRLVILYHIVVSGPYHFRFRDAIYVAVQAEGLANCSFGVMKPLYKMRCLWMEL